MYTYNQGGAYFSSINLNIKHFSVFVSLSLSTLLKLRSCYHSFARANIHAYVFFYSNILVLAFCLFWSKVSLCSPGWLGAGFVDQVGLELPEISLPSAGLKAMHHLSGLGHVLNLYLTWYQELCNFDICQTKDKCSSFHMILFHLCLFPVSNSVDASGLLSKWNFSVFCCKYLCCRFCLSLGLLAVSSPTSASPLHVGFSLPLPLFGPSDKFFFFFFAFHLPHLSQLTLAIVCT